MATFMATLKMRIIIIKRMLGLNSRAKS